MKISIISAKKLVMNEYEKRNCMLVSRGWGKDRGKLKS